MLQFQCIKPRKLSSTRLNQARRMSPITLKISSQQTKLHLCVNIRLTPISWFMSTCYMRALQAVSRQLPSVSSFYDLRKVLKCSSCIRTGRSSRGAAVGGGFMSRGENILFLLAHADLYVRVLDPCSCAWGKAMVS